MGSIFVTLRNEYTGKSVCSPMIDPVDFLKHLGINNIVCKIAMDKCNVDDPHIYVEISRETFDGDTCYSIGILALETEISEEDLKDIPRATLNLYVLLKGLLEGYTGGDLLMGPKGKEVLEFYFSLTLE